MLDAYPTTTREAELLARIEQIAESIAYVAPEVADQRRTEIVSNIRREIRDWRRA